jgi:hypothetical protein
MPCALRETYGVAVSGALLSPSSSVGSGEVVAVRMQFARGGLLLSDRYRCQSDDVISLSVRYTGSKFCDIAISDYGGVVAGMRQPWAISRRTLYKSRMTIPMADGMEHSMKPSWGASSERSHSY